VESLLFPRAGEAVALITLKGVTDSRALSARENALSPALLIDLKQEIGELVASYRQQIILYSGIGIILIMALLFAHLRHFGATLRVILPSLLGMLCTVAVLHLSGARLNLFHLVALLLVLGVGINYALFFNRIATDRADENRVLFSLLICLVSTLIGFGALVISSIPVLHSIGITAFCGTVFSFLFSAWLAPKIRVRSSLPA
jgi:predicted exporter